MNRKKSQILEEIKRLQYINSMREKEHEKLNIRINESQNQTPNQILTNRLDFIRSEIVENKRKIDELQKHIN